MKNKYSKLAFILLILLVLILSACGPKENEFEIRIGGIFDLTGATHEICVPYADGVRNYIQYKNEQGGINGKTIKLIEHDSAYIVSRAKMAYEQLVKKDKVIAILGWGTGSTEFLIPLVAKDKVPFMSASYSTNLGNIEEAPYNFLIGATYSDQIKIVLRYIKDLWDDKTRPPRVALIYNDTAFGKSPIQDGKDFAAAYGIDIVCEEIVSLDAREAKAQLLHIKQQKADFAIIQETTWAASVILKDANKLGLTTQFIGLNWCVDEKLIALAGEAAEGFIGTIPFIFTDDTIPGIVEIMNYNEKQGINIEGYILRYIQGWVTAEIMLEGIRKAGSQLSGIRIKNALESITNFSTGMITGPITFTAADHKGSKTLKLGMVKNGKWQIITDYISLE
jgi:branched-chain amino acid transport system substrate-binding protein